MEKGLDVKFIILTIIGALVLSAILLGFRGMALKNAYDAGTAFTINDSAGVVHSVAASPINGDVTALIYNILTGLVWLIAVFLIIMKVLGKF